MEKKVLKSVKNKYKFHCSICNYTASQKSHYNKHIGTKKHMRMMEINGGKSVKKVLNTVVTSYKCKTCNKEYKDRSGLRYHIKRGCINNTSLKINDLSNKVTKLANSINEVVDSGILGPKQVITNNNISINFFLDKYCNNAQSLQEFVENISFKLNDILYENEMIDNFISKKVLKNLQDIPITERPIHCTDQKRRNFMVKDKNEGWVKDSVDTNGSLSTQVKNLHNKAYINFYTEYDKENPLPHNPDDETLKCEIASKLLNYDKKEIVNNIAKTVDIKNILEKPNTIEDDVINTNTSNIDV